MVFHLLPCHLVELLFFREVGSSAQDSKYAAYPFDGLEGPDSSLAHLCKTWKPMHHPLEKSVPEGHWLGTCDIYIERERDLYASIFILCTSMSPLWKNDVHVCIQIYIYVCVCIYIYNYIYIYSR